MNNCPNCKIVIHDDSATCPLCLRGIDRGEALEAGSRSVMYPEVKDTIKKLKFATRIVVFAAIVVEIVAVYVNFLTFTGVHWSVLSAIALLYGVFSLIYSVRNNKSIQRKIVVQLAIALLLTLAVDYVLGYKGWALSYAIPLEILAVNIGMLVLMIIQFKEWTRFLYPSIWVTVMAVIALILNYIIGIDNYLLATIALIVSAMFIVGLIILGGRKAASEIERRFHI